MTRQHKQMSTSRYAARALDAAVLRSFRGTECLGNPVEGQRLPSRLELPV